MLDTSNFRKHLQALDSKNEGSRREALHALRDFQKQEWDSAPREVIQAVVTSLQQQLGSPNQPLLRQEAASILGNLGPRSEPAIPQLVELLQDGLNHRLRETAAMALGKIGKKAGLAVGKLLDVLPTSQPAAAVQIVRALGDIGRADQKVRTVLVALWLSPPTPAVQIQAAIALCKLGIEANGLLKALTKALVANPDLALRKAAAEALAWRNKNEVDVVPALLLALNDKNEEVRQAGETSLARLRLSREKAIRLCAGQLKDSAFAEAALRNGGPAAIPSLIEALEAEEPSVRVAASRILGHFGEAAASASGQLTKLLQDRNELVRLAAAKSLWNITKNPDRIVPVLAGLLSKKRPFSPEDAEARRQFLQTVIEALRRIGPPAHAAIPALKEKSRDKNRYVSESALGALGEIAPNGVKAMGVR